MMDNPFPANLCAVCHEKHGGHYRIAGTYRGSDGIPQNLYVHPECLARAGQLVKVPGVMIITQSRPRLVQEMA